MLLQEFEIDLDKRDGISEKRLKLEDTRADLVRANIAFHAGRAVMTPPSSDLVADIVDNTKSVVELTVERATVSAVLRLSTKALNMFAEIQDIGRA